MLRLTVFEFRLRPCSRLHHLRSYPGRPRSCSNHRQRPCSVIHRRTSSVQHIFFAERFRRSLLYVDVYMIINCKSLLQVDVHINIDVQQRPTESLGGSTASGGRSSTNLTWNLYNVVRCSCNGVCISYNLTWILYNVTCTYII